MTIKERNGGEFRTDLSVAQPPCTRCKHAYICDLPPTCHALRYFEKTGRRITPPLIFPGKRQQEPAPAPEPASRQRTVKGLTEDQTEALRQFDREMETLSKEPPA